MGSDATHSGSRSHGGRQVIREITLQLHYLSLCLCPSLTIIVFFFLYLQPLSCLRCFVSFFLTIQSQLCYQQHYSTPIMLKKLCLKSKISRQINSVKGQLQFKKWEFHVRQWTQNQFLVRIPSSTKCVSVKIYLLYLFKIRLTFIITKIVCSLLKSILQHSSAQQYIWRNRRFKIYSLWHPGVSAGWLITSR